MGRCGGKLISAFRWWVKWGAQYKSKLGFAETDNTVYAERVRLSEQSYQIHHDKTKLQREITEHDAWLSARKQPCFQESDYSLFLAHWGPPSLAGEIWHGYRNLAGDRTMIILPMGGALPGAIPWRASQEYLETAMVLDPDEYDTVRALWAHMDAMSSEPKSKGK